MDRCSKCRAWRAAGTSCLCDLLGGDTNYVWDPSSAPLTAQEEARQVGEAWARDEQKMGRPYFVLSQQWFSAWCDYTLYDRAPSSVPGNRPPSIDNTELVVEGANNAAGVFNVRMGLAERYDYIVVPPLVWLRLWAWYGGGPTIMRVVIRSRLAMAVDLYPVDIHVTTDSGEPPFVLQLPASNTLRNVRHWACTKHSKPPHKHSLVVRTPNEKDPAVMDETPITDDQLKMTLEEFGCESKLSIVLKGSAGVDDLSVLGMTYGSGAWRPARPPENELGECLARGIAGLHNLGNTCFMNAALQCLSALPPLTNMLLKDELWVPHINDTNIVGSKGLLTRSLAGLLAEMWSGHYRVVVPTEFRKQLQAVAPQFRGYQQHDAQEMLLVTLNAMHEDLLAPAGPNGHRVEKSCVQDLFGGRYRSTVTCETCSTQSTVYEPFLNVALPVPEKEERKLVVTFFPVDAAPQHVGVRVNKQGNVAHVYSRLGDALGRPVSAHRLVSAQVSGNGVCYVLADSKAIGAFREKDRVLVFECPPALDDELRHVFVFSYARGASGQAWHANAVSSLGFPVLVWYRKGASASEVAATVRRRFVELADVHCNDDNTFRLIKFGGKQEFEAQPAFPWLASEFHSAADLAIGVLWNDRQADALGLAYRAIPTHASCEAGADDAELRTSLADCFQLASAPDALSLSNSFRCNTCQALRDAVKVMTLNAVPPILCLHLKRFKLDFVVKEKLHTNVDFPDEIDMRPFAEATALPASAVDGRYRLVGVINHHGGLSGGHYTACARNVLSGDWYRLDDRVSAAMGPGETPVSAAAYVLMYVAVGLLDVQLPDPVPVVIKAADGAAAAVGATGGGAAAGSDVAVDPDLAAALAASLHVDAATVAQKKPKTSAFVEGMSYSDVVTAAHATPEPPQRLDTSAYICELCSNPIPGGFDALSKHWKDAHDYAME